jgi:hypothetical protein
VLPDPRSLLEREDRRELSELQRRQQALRKRLQSMNARLERDDDGRGSAFAGPELLHGLEETSELMGKASRTLRAQQPQEALSAQEAAAEQLDALRKQMEATRRPMAWGSDGKGGPRERIVIPGAESFQPPRAFRQDILDAMKEKAPQTYRRQVKEYYEELVR